MTAEARPTIPAERFAERLARARSGLVENGAAALLIGVGADLVYLTGYTAMPLERLTMLVVPQRGRPSLIAPRLEAMRAGGSPAAAAGLVDVVSWDETDDAHAIAARLATAGSDDRDGAGAGARHGGQAGRVGQAAGVLVDPGLWALHVLPLQRAIGDRRFGLATDVLGPLRMVKDADEVTLLRLAAEAADRALAAVADGPLIGRTEAEVSREIRERLVAEGHDESLFAIVGSGPNSASPHHDPGERRIQAGEPVVLDIGGLLGGYASDTTRTIWVAGPDRDRLPDPEFVRIHELVREANAAATDAARPGQTCESIDGVARRLIEQGGYGPRFIHRVGHGIGLEGHEEPYLVGGSRTLLRPGVSFSIEPGIYLEGRYGVRIEDIVVCGDDAPIVLNRLPRELWLVDG